MKRLSIALMVAGMFVAYGCSPKATAEECKAACTKQGELTKPAAPAGMDVVAKVEAEFAPKLAEAQKPLAEALAKLDADYAKKMSKAKGKAKDKFTAELGKKKEAKTAELQPKVAELNKAKMAAVEAAMAIKTKADADAQAAADAALATCTDGCVTGGISQAMAVCQAGAADMAAYSACQ